MDREKYIPRMIDAVIELPDGVFAVPITALKNEIS